MSFEHRARLFETHARNAAQGSRHACIIPRHQTNAQKQPLVGAVIGVVLVGLLVWLFTTESMSGSYLGYMAQQGVAETEAIQAATIFSPYTDSWPFSTAPSCLWDTPPSIA